MILNEELYRQAKTHHLMSVARKRAAHCERVAAICKEIVEELPCWYEVNEPLLCCAAQAHDICKLERNKDHHKKAKKALKKELGIKVSSKEVKQVCRVIEAHKGKFKPEKKKIALEAAILRVADKIDRIDQGKSGAVDDYWDSLEKIEDYFDTKKNLPCSYDTVEDACEAVRKRRQPVRPFLERRKYHVTYR